MRSSQSTTYCRKTGYIERIDLKIYPEELTLKSSTNGSLYLLNAIEKALCKDNARAIKEVKAAIRAAKKLGKNK